MIDRINPASIAGVDTSKKSERTSTSAVSESESVANTITPSEIIRTNQITGQYSSSYLKARDTQDNISYSQSRNSALANILASLNQLKTSALQYESVKKSASLESLDSIVAQAQQALNSIDVAASSSQFQGAQTAGDVNSSDLGLDVVNLESGSPLAQINKAISTVSAKMAYTDGKATVAEARLNNIKNYSTSVNSTLTEYEAKQIAEQIAKSMGLTSSEDLYAEYLTPDKVSRLIGQ